MIFHLIRRLIPHKPNCYKNVLHLSTESFAEYNYKEQSPHIPVMVNEVVEHLNLKEGNVFLDMTFGAGGHSTALLERIPDLKVIALDRDPISQSYAKELQRLYPGQVIPLEGKFSDLPTLLEDTDYKQNSIDGILFDLGCSSMQLDCPERGFTMTYDGPLDMRMDGDRISNQLTAGEIVNYACEEDLYKIIKTYGEERKAPKIVSAIISARENSQSIKTTKNLVDIIEGACRNFKTERTTGATAVATKVFQGLRIFVNNEINELNFGIILAGRYLKPNCRAVVISYSVVQDKLVKSHFHNQIVDNCHGPLQLVYSNPQKSFDLDELKAFKKDFWEPVNKKVIVPSKEEKSANPRSTSAKLRAAIKLAQE